MDQFEDPEPIEPSYYVSSLYLYSLPPSSIFLTRLFIILSYHQPTFLYDPNGYIFYILIYFNMKYLYFTIYINKWWTWQLAAASLKDKFWIERKLNSNYIFLGFLFTTEEALPLHYHHQEIILIVYSTHPQSQPPSFTYRFWNKSTLLAITISSPADTTKDR